MAKQRIGCVVCGGKLTAQTVTITENEEGDAQVEEIAGFTCSDCGIHYDNPPKSKIVKIKKWEQKVIDEMGGAE